MPFAVTVIFNVLLLFCSILMVLSSVLLILGLRQVSVLKRTLSTSITDGTSIPAEPPFAEQAASADTLDLLYVGRPAHRGLPPGALVPLPPRQIRSDCGFHLHHGLLPPVPQREFKRLLKPITAIHELTIRTAFVIYMLIWLVSLQIILTL